MENPLAIKIEKGTAKIKVSSENFFKALKNTISDLGDLKFGTLLNRYVQIFELKTEEQALAFELVFVPLCNAIHLQTKNIIGHYDSYAQMQELTWSIENTAEEFEILIDESFFDDVLNMEFFKSVKEVLLISWKEIGLSEAESKNILHNLGNSYLTELLVYWYGNTDKFKPVLIKFSDNPFYSRWKNEQQKLRYYEKLKSLFYSPAMGDEKITLNEVYIHQNFKIYQDCLANDKRNVDNIDSEGFFSVKEQIDIHEYTEEYFLKRKNFKSLENQQRNLMLVLGQPGQGKTSFIIRTAYSLLNNPEFNRNLYLLPLRKIEVVDRFINQPMDEITNYFSGVGLEFTTNNSVLLLDGLDELYMSAGFNKQQIIDFFSRLERATERDDNNLHIIITSRYNYVDLKYLSSRFLLTICLEELTLWQQIEWLKKYKEFYKNCKLTEAKLKEIGDESNYQYKAIRELITQAILLHIVARADFEIDSNYNRSAIYDKLFTALINRKWSRQGKLERFNKIEKKSLREYISHIALKIYQSPNEYITRYELNKMDETTEFIEANNLKFDELGSSLKEVLVNFYFRNIKRVNDEIRDDNHEFAIEFLHKSLQEYLAAERIYQLFVDSFTDKNTKGKYIITDWKPALEFAWQILSPKRISHEVRSYIVEIIHNDSNIDKKKELANRMNHFLPELLKRHFLWEYSAKTGSYYPIEQASSVFYGYWSILIELVKGENFILNDIRVDFVNNLMIALLPGGGGNLSFQNLEQTNLRGANLQGANLQGADLYRADLQGADLHKANLQGANLLGADLRKANLLGADLYRADLQGANLYRADLQGADLHKANLYRADLQGADLRKANLYRANLYRAYLLEANLLEADLREANLQGADLLGANLYRANLYRANLQGANLYRAYLHKANLLEADLRKANLQGADLYRAYLLEADLRKANLHKANLQGANFSSAITTGMLIDNKTIIEGAIGLDDFEQNG